MEKNYKNKMVSEAKTKLLEFFYPGGTEFEPMTILALSQEKADELYEARRKKVDSN